MSEELSSYKLSSDERPAQDTLRAVCSGTLIFGGLDGKLQGTAAVLPSAIYSIELIKPSYHVVGTRTGALYLLDGGHLLQELRDHQNVCSSINVDDTLVVTAGWDTMIFVYQFDRENRRLNKIRSLKLPIYSHTTCAAILPKQRLLATASSSKILAVVDIDAGEPIHVVEEAHSDVIRKILCVNDIIITASNDGLVKFWDKNLNALMHWIPSDRLSFVFGISSHVLHPNLILCAAACDDGTVSICAVDPEEKKCLRSCVLWESVRTAWDVAFSHAEPGNLPDVLAVYDDGSARRFSTQTSLPSEVIEKKRAEFRQKALENQKKLETSSLDASKLTKARDRHTVRADTVGKTTLFVEDDGLTVGCYSWTGTEWAKVGDMVPEDNAGITSETQLYEGDELFPAGRYDRIFFVEIETKPNYRAKLPYRFTDNTMEVAERFCAREAIGKQNVPDIVSFIQANCSAPAAAAAPPQKQPAQAQGKPAPKIGVSFVPVIFDANRDQWAPAHQKILALNDQQKPEAQLNASQKALLASLIASLSSRTKFMKSDMRPAIFQLFLADPIWRSWEPADERFPMYDLARMLACHPDVSDALLRTGRGAQQIEECFQLLEERRCLQQPSALGLCVARYLANLPSVSCTRAWINENLSHVAAKVKKSIANLPPEEGPIDKAENSRCQILTAICAFSLNCAIGVAREFKPIGSQQKLEAQVQSANEMYELFAVICGLRKTREGCQGPSFGLWGMTVLDSMPLSGSLLEAAERFRKEVRTRGVEQWMRLMNMTSVDAPPPGVSSITMEALKHLRSPP